MEKIMTIKNTTKRFVVVEDSHEKEWYKDPDNDPYYNSHQFELDIKYGTANYDGCYPAWLIPWGKQRDF